MESKVLQKTAERPGWGTWPLGFEPLLFCYDCLRCDDFNVLRFWAGRPPPFTLAFDNSALTPVAVFAESTLYRAARACEVGVLIKRLPRVIAGAIKIGNESAVNEETVKVCGFRGLDGSRRNLLIVHGFSAPSGFALLLFPCIELGETAVVVVAQALRFWARFKHRSAAAEPTSDWKMRKAGRREKLPKSPRQLPLAQSETTNGLHRRP